METGMTSKLRNTGIGPVGYRPWGTHFCNFYATKTDLVEMLVPYFKAGLENKEFCVWVISEPLTEPEAWSALRETIPEIDEYLADGSIEIFHAGEWYLKHGSFDMVRVIRAWNDKLSRALDRGYAGLRVSGDTSWLAKKGLELPLPLRESARRQRGGSECDRALHLPDGNEWGGRSA